MVDEYQDTNTAQFELIRLLAGKYKNLCVVGDDDQSIYKFRGANIYNILNFEKHYPDAISHQAGAELPFDAEYSERGEWCDCEQRGQKGEVALDGQTAKERRLTLSSLTRPTRRRIMSQGILRPASGKESMVTATVRCSTARMRSPVCLRSVLCVCKYPVQDCRRCEFLCAQGGQGSAGVLKDDRQCAGTIWRCEESSMYRSAELVRRR